jgi:hypothetical protein
VIEPLFITTDGDGRAVRTPIGRRHVELLEQYGSLIDRMEPALAEDCSRFRPVAGAYSPYGVLYGFSTDLLEHMAFKVAQPEAVGRFGLEDVFIASEAGDGDKSAAKLAWVNGWRKLPHLTRDVEKQFGYPQQFAEEMFERIERALRRRVDGETKDARTGQLFILPEEDTPVDAERAQSYDESRLLSDRREGRSLLSYKTASGWVAVSKDVLTDVLAEGRDMKLGGVPPTAAAALKLMYPQLVVPA